MRHYLKIALLLLLAASMLLVSCGEYSPAIKDPGHGTDDSETPNEPGTVDPDDPNPFTVTLMYDGKVFTPYAQQPLTVQWNDGYAIHTAPVGEDGVARISGLDGDYRVTLSEAPIGYGYDPNAYTATSDATGRHLVIQLHKLVPTKGHGDQLYSAITIRNTGVYYVEIENDQQEVFFQFEPAEGGTYTVESWIDTTANVVNPIAKYYGANPAFKELLSTVDDGGAANTYTKNFKLEVQIADEQIGANMQPAFTFGIMGTSSDPEQYPLKIYFAITLDGEFSLEHIESTLMLPSETLEQQKDYDPELYEFVGAEFSQTVNGNTANVFDSDNYRLWPKSEGGDNYYHLYDPEQYPETGGYGPILYAKISAACRFMGEAFTMLEYAGNKALTVSDGTENYKLFIEGYDALNSYTLSDSNPNGTPPYFCTLECPCRESGSCDSVAITGSVGACITGCENCHPDCRTIPAEAIGHKGYGDYTNSDGCYAVTEELKEFLQKYSISQWLFFDGQGFVETHSTIRVFAAEEDQWLFACGYYREK